MAPQSNKMVYEWESKRDECFMMYITQNKSLEEIIEFYRRQNFVPRYVVDSTALRQPDGQMRYVTLAVHSIFLPKALPFETILNRAAQSSRIYSLTPLSSPLSSSS